MNIEKTSNLKSVSEFVSYIRERIEDSNRKWWEIAHAFAEARDMYGLDSNRFKDLCKETAFSISKATKLAKIAESDRLKSYAGKLSAVHSWGTLYAITTLNEDKFEDLKKVYKFDEDDSVVPFITQQAVERIRKGPSERSFLKNYAVIQIDEDSLKGGLLSGDDLEELYRLIAKIDNISSYVRVKRTEIDEKNNIFWLNRIEDRVKQIARKKLTDAVSARLAQRKKTPTEKTDAYELRCLGVSRRELYEMFYVDPRKAFEYLGVEYDINGYYRQAEKEIGSEQDVFADRAMKHDKVDSIPMLPENDEVIEENPKLLRQVPRTTFDRSAFAGFK